MPLRGITDVDPSSARLRILQIDDSPDYRLLIKRALKKEFPDLQFTDITQAQAFSQALDEGQFDLVITDHHLRWTDGLKVLREVKARHPQCPVILCTTNGSEELAVAAMKAGLDDYVIKSPQHLVRLLAAVRSVWAKARHDKALQATVEALRESEERCRLVARATNDVIWDWNIVKDEVLWTEALRTILGYAPEDISTRFEDVYQWWYEHIHPQDREAIAASLKTVLAGSGNTWSEEYRFRRANGSYATILDRAFIIRNEQGEAVRMVGAMLDITAPKQSEVKYRTLFETMAQGVVYQNAVGEITSANPAAERILGLTLAQMQDRTSADPRWRAIDEEGSEFTGETHPSMVALMTGKEVSNVMMGIFNPVDGDYRWINVHAIPLFQKGEDKPYQVYTTFDDITLHKQTKDALHRYAERLEVLHEMDRAILTAQSPEALAEAGLAHLQHLVPCQRADLYLFDLPHREATLLAIQGVGMSLLGKGARLPLELFGGVDALAQGRIRQVEALDLSSYLQSNPLIQPLLAEGLRACLSVPLVANGELRGVLKLWRDTPGSFEVEHTDIAREVANQLALSLRQAQLLDQVKAYASKLEQRVAERTAALRETVADLESFTRSVAHDLREPLVGMQGLIHLLWEDYAGQLPAQARNYLRRILAAAERMDILIQDLLNYSRLGRTELHTQPVSLSAVINECLSSQEPQLHKRDAQVSVEEPLPEVIGHYGTLVQVITNLLSNAIKFVVPGVQPHVRIKAEIRDGRVRLWVKDNGIGIAPEAQERIFEVFERLHGEEVYPGTGIGLAIVRRGIERMGGQVSVQSKPDRGSCFWIELPSANHG